ncbi:MAG: VCBS repeat-containing protein, partial [Acidobacteria bacterium]|nr:VCBS repeat-containing protein [Acidobacteriota bacterium]
SSPTGGATIGTNSNTSVKITNVEPSLIAFDSSRHFDREGRTVTFEVFRAFNQIGTVSVDYATSSGSATGGSSCAPGIDFINTSGTLVFPPGTFNRSFTVQTCTDAIFEEIETANVTLSNVSGAQLNTPSTTTLNIFQSSWQKQATFPTGQTLEDVQMISANEGWAAGGYGVILHTVDGGITWERQASGTYQSLNTVYFKDALHGWASGNVDVYTDDGGRTWQQGFRTGVGAGGSVYGLTFADLNRGFQVTNSNSSFNRSTDGGRTWFAQDTPFPVNLIKFFDPLNGIASSGQGVLVTSDGGQTWTVRPGATGGAEWFDTNRGWRINNTEFVNGLIRQKIDYTTNGGVTWTQGATPAGTFVFKLYFLDALNGWGVGTNENIIRTTDGGVTWQTLRGGINAPLRFSYPLEDIHMADTLHGVAVGNTGLIYITADGGATWAPRQTGGGYPVYKMVATDARHAWGGSYNGDLLYTTDGGRFWNRQRIAIGNSPQNALISGLAFPDNQRGWAGLRGGASPEQTGTTILYTINGGRDWHDTTAPGHVCYALDTFDGQTIVSVGFDGAGAPIVRSTDGGQTWTLMHFPLSEVIRDVDMASPNIGYAAAGAQIIKSTDGFATWTRVVIGGNWFDVSFADVNNGWALGEGPSNTGRELWHTTDGGQTWDSKPMEKAVAVYAVNPQTVWVVEHDYDPNPLGDATFGLRSTDGGQTFTRELISLNSISTAIAFVDPDNGWVGGVTQETSNLSVDGAEVFRRGTRGLTGSTPFDFDGDGSSDLSVFRPSNATWYLNRSGQGVSYTQFGLASDRIAPADYDGDGKTDIAVFRDGNWYILQSSNNQVRGVQFGQSGDVAAPADYDGDGKADVAVFRQGSWYILESSTNAFRGVQFGAAGDTVAPADYDGDGKADIAVFRSGTWYLLRSQAGFAAVQFGLATDIPVAADYDNDGQADVAVFRDGNWYALASSNNQVRGVQFGQSGDVPVPADYDGDGQADQAVYRAGVWHLLRSTGGITSVSFGLSSDVPVP